MKKNCSHIRIAAAKVFMYQGMVRKVWLDPNFCAAMELLKERPFPTSFTLRILPKMMDIQDIFLAICPQFPFRVVTVIVAGPIMCELLRYGKKSKKYKSSAQILGQNSWR